MEETRLGAILLESGILREDDLERCLEIQALTGGDRPLGQILVDQKIVTSATLERLLELQAQRRDSVSRAAGGLDGTEDPTDLLETAIDCGVTELHLSEGRPPLLRVATQLEALGNEPVFGPEVWSFVQQYMGPEVLECLADQRSVTRELRMPGKARGRVTASRHFDGIHVVVRFHPWATRDLATIEPDPRLHELVAGSRGLVLVCGEHGSGVSSTMASMLRAVAQGSSDRFVLVLDETFEFFDADTDATHAIVSMRRVREHTRNWVTGLTSALHEDPDVLFVGDVSDPHAFDIALRAAETDRLVVAAVPGANVREALERIENGYAEQDLRRARTMLASTLRAVLAVRLLPAEKDPGACIATEFLHVDENVRDLLGSGGLARVDLLLQMGDSTIGHCLDDRLLELVQDGKVAFEDAFAFARDKARLMNTSSGVEA
jgi:twitching motility protein PilT